jgi:RNA-directed DNA polymerase
MILKMDFSDFFPSITSFDWRQYCRDTGCLSDEADIEMTSLLLFRQIGNSSRLRLAIGAPSSPTLSNALMFEFDSRIQEIVAEDKVTYTRYADDLTFSAPRTGFLKDVVRNVKRVLDGLVYPKIRINDEKTIMATTKYRRNVTGLILSNDGRVTIGRYRKRLLSAMINRARKGMLTQPQEQYLAGYLAFAGSIEPGFVAALKRRYGSELVSRIQRTIVMGTKIPVDVKDTMALSRAD